MTSFGYTLSSEEHPPGDVVRQARRAEEAGFDFVSISDHFHPWVSDQGHSPFVWSVLGADDEEPFRGDVLPIEAEQDRSGATITLVGEFDMTGSERFWAFVSEALATSPRSDLVDASGLGFTDSTRVDSDRACP